MNIFVVEGNKNNIDFVRSAQSLDNMRTVKMITESVQLLSTALTVNGIKGPYRTFNPKHPSCLWTAESSQNFFNLMEHTNALIKEYFKRFGAKSHAAHIAFKQCHHLFMHNYKQFPTDIETPFRMAIPENYKDSSDVVGSYRKFYASKTNFIYPVDKVPSWFVELRGSKTFKIKEPNGIIHVYKAETNS